MSSAAKATRRACSRAKIAAMAGCASPTRAVRKQPSSSWSSCRPAAPCGRGRWQRFRPKSPYDGRGGETDFKPYGVGYVELPGELIVEGRIVADHLESLTIGQPMRVTTEAYRETPAGEPVLTYAFTPDTGGHA